MKKAKWIRILVASVMLAFLGACAGTMGGSGGPSEPDSAYPAG